MLKKRLFFVIYSIIIILMTSCSSTQNNEKLSFSEFSIGEGGGATGMISGFTIESSGKLFQWRGRLKKDTLKELKKLDSDTLKFIEDIITKSNLIDLKYEKPENFYRFINIKMNEKENYLVWAPYFQSDTTTNLNEIYEKIISIINNSK
ncbi:MAG: hypothetical protein N2319_12630 [Candidatus Kapabacteria bacterium]|nr:hypothetical protein [Candidatus Kapabacteria bacterium]